MVDRSPQRFSIAIDIGGTFVDAIEFDADGGGIRLAKAPTTPARPADGVLEAIGRLGTPLGRTGVLVHGTTLGLNAIIERKGARTGILTNTGFRDIFEIGRADVPRAEMYNPTYRRPEPVVLRRHRLGVPGRLDAQGNLVDELDENAVIGAVRRLVDQGVEALAIAFLHAYRNPVHERRAVEIINAAFPGLPVSTSSAVSGEYREYERTSTTVLDAYIRPIFEAYVGELQAALKDRGFAGRFLIMRSSGGAMTAEVAAATPLLTVMSGPAGGIVGATAMARLLDLPHVLSLDYGGTSLDAAVIEQGRPLVMHEASLERLPVQIPIFDIRCIGAGGGSIAWVEDGLMQVGPRSAGAVPGPIAYGKGGTEPTTTDAALILGFIDPARFLGGDMPLDAAASARGMAERIAAPLGCDVTAAAAGIFDILIAKTIGAVREITTERGKDLGDFVLLAFGGAGPLIGPLIAREVGAIQLIVPHVPAAFSAWGMLMSDLVTEMSQTCIAKLSEAQWPDVVLGFATLERTARIRLENQGVAAQDQVTERSLECRYRGQEHAISVGIDTDSTAASTAVAFNRLHRARYGHALEESIQTVTLRVRAIGTVKKPPIRTRHAMSNAASRPSGKRPAFCFSVRKTVDFDIYARDSLVPGMRLEGPAIIEEGTATTVVHSDQAVAVDEYGHLLIGGRRL